MGVEKKESQEMFEGVIWKTTLRLSLPLMLGSFVYFFYQFVDTAFISLIDRQSTAIISGMGLVIPLFIIAIALSLGLNMGVSALVARGIGEKNRMVIERVADSGFLIAFVVSVLVLAAGYIFGKDLLRLMAGAAISEDALQWGWEYLVFIMPGFAVLMFGRVLMGILQGEGLNKPIAAAMVISTGLNIILDPIFIFLLRMGVGGAALATSVSIFAAFFYLLNPFRRGRTQTRLGLNILKANKTLVKEIVRVGLPHSLGRLAEGISYMFLNGLVSSIGEASMNSWTLCIRTDQLALVPVGACSGANLTMIGQNYGKGHLERVHSIYRVNALFTAAVLTFFAGLYFAASPIIFQAFSSLPHVVEGSVRQVRFLAFTFIGTAVTMITVSTFQAIGYPGRGLLLTILRLGFISVPLAFLLVTFTELGMNGVFIAIGSSNILILIVAWFWGNWTLRKVEHRVIG